MVKRTTAKKTTTKKPTKRAVKKPVEQKPPTTPVETETPVQAPETPQITLKSVLMMYNSVVPSRRRQIRNRNLLRNNWKELFQLLEKASGRDGAKVSLYDYNWHEQAEKGGTIGLIDKKADAIDIVVDGQAVADTSEKDLRIKQLESELAQKQEELMRAFTTIGEYDAELAAVRDANTVAQESHVISDDEPLPGETNTEKATDETTTAQKASEATETTPTA